MATVPPRVPDSAPELPDDRTLFRTLFAHMLNAALVGQLIFDGDEPVDFLCVDVNPAFAPASGLTDVIGKRANELLPNFRDRYPDSLATYARVVRSGVPERFERYQPVRKIWYAGSVSRLAADVFLLVFEITTERKRSESALREPGDTAADQATQALRSSEERWATIFHATRTAMTVVELASGHFIDVNAAFERIFGWTRVQLIGKTSAEIGFYVERRDREKLYEKLLAHGQGSLDEVGFRTQAGEAGVCSMSAACIELAGKTCVVCSVHDITERKRGEAAISQALAELRASEEKYRRLIDNLEDVVYSADLEGRLTYVTPAIARYGYSPEELLGQHPLMLALPEDRARLSAARKDVLAGQPARSVEYRLLDKQGGIHFVRSSKRPLVVDGQVVGVTGLLVDLTHLRETEEQLRAAQKMEAIGRLAGGVAHDFNNHLCVILACTELALALPTLDLELRTNLSEVSLAAKRAAELTRQLLAFSRRQMLAPQSLDLNALVSSTGKMLLRVVGEDIALSLSLAPSLARVYADAGQLDQVLMNLVVNARDAMPDGGRLTIATTNVQLDPSQAAALELSAGPYVELAVTDTGVGMDPVTRSRLFEPFFTTKAIGKGTGLGLSTVYGIVRQSGGGIAVTTVPLKGSTFAVYLPTYTGFSPAKPTVEPPAQLNRGNETVLVVEDEPVLRRMVLRVLTKAGYLVHSAANPAEALTVLAKLDKPPALLLTDIVMPGKNGQQLAAQVLSLHPSIKVLFISGYADDTLVRYALSEANFLSKPFTPSTLTDKVRAVLDEG